MNRRQTGIRGEGMALEYLQSQGYQLLEKNWRCRLGEIDLVMLSQGTVVFIEVKTRSNEHYGLPQEAVDWRKRERIRKLAQLYLEGHRLGSAQPRFDVVAVSLQGDRPKIEHLQSAF